jgi:hypothetical protein
MTPLAKKSGRTIFLVRTFLLYKKKQFIQLFFFFFLIGCEYNEKGLQSYGTKKVEGEIFPKHRGKDAYKG